MRRAILLFKNLFSKGTEWWYIGFLSAPEDKLTEMLLCLWEEDIKYILPFKLTGKLLMSHCHISKPNPYENEISGFFQAKWPY